MNSRRFGLIIINGVMICTTLLLATNFKYRKKATDVTVHSVVFLKTAADSFFGNSMHAGCINTHVQQKPQVKNSSAVVITNPTTNKLNSDINKTYVVADGSCAPQLEFLSQLIDKSELYIQLFKNRLGLLFDINDKRSLTIHKQELMQTIMQMKSELELALAYHLAQHEMPNAMKDVFSKMETIFKEFTKNLILFHDKLDPQAYTVVLARNLYNELPALKTSIKDCVQQIEIISGLLKPYDLQVSEKVRLLGEQLGKFLEGVDQSSYAMVNAIRHRLNC